MALVKAAASLRSALLLGALGLWSGASTTYAFAGPKEKTASSDAQIEALARKGLASQDPAERREIATKLKRHRFKSPAAPEREFVLYAQGILEDRLGERLKAAVTLKKLERGWPSSPYLAEAQFILASAAVEGRRLKEAEGRLEKAIRADIPVENKRKAQELLLWILVEQGRAEEGLSIVKSLYPLPSGDKPTERGLVAMLEVLCLEDNRRAAESARRELKALYPKSAFLPRTELAWGQYLGRNGSAKASAEVLRALLKNHPDSPQADDARLALATLLTDGKLTPREAANIPSAQQLLNAIRREGLKGDKPHQAMLLQLRVFMNQGQWKEAVDIAAHLESQTSDKERSTLVKKLRGEAIGAWTQQALDANQITPLLPYLDLENVANLAPEQRTALIKRLAQTGLSGSAQALTSRAPGKEQEALRKVILEATAANTQSQETLDLLSGRKRRGESAAESLRRAEALVDLKRWKEVPGALARATPGASRISALLAYLRRPVDKGDAAGKRLKEAEGWLARSREKGQIREPLVIFVADLRCMAGNWKSALAIYPAKATGNDQGWVSLMRATCQMKLGQKDAAKATLKANIDAPGFKMERQTLSKQLGM